MLGRGHDRALYAGPHSASALPVHPLAGFLYRSAESPNNPPGKVTSASEETAGAHSRSTAFALPRAGHGLCACKSSAPLDGVLPPEWRHVHDVGVALVFALML